MNDVLPPTRRYRIDEEQNTGYAEPTESVNGRGRRAFAGAQAFRAANAAPRAKLAKNVPLGAQPNAQQIPSLMQCHVLIRNSTRTLETHSTTHSSALLHLCLMHLTLHNSRLHKIPSIPHSQAVMHNGVSPISLLSLLALMVLICYQQVKKQVVI